MHIYVSEISSLDLLLERSLLACDVSNCMSSQQDNKIQFYHSAQIWYIKDLSANISSPFVTDGYFLRFDAECELKKRGVLTFSLLLNCRKLFSFPSRSFQSKL